MNRKQRRAAKSQGGEPGRAASGRSTSASPQIAERFAAALSHHQAGRLAEAESLYRQICAIEPDHVDSLDYRGVLAGEIGRNDSAIALA